MRALVVSPCPGVPGAPVPSNSPITRRSALSLMPRYESGETVAEHIRAVQPDIAIVMLSAQSAGSYEAYTDFGTVALTD